MSSAPPTSISLSSRRQFDVAAVSGPPDAFSPHQSSPSTPPGQHSGGTQLATSNILVDRGTFAMLAVLIATIATLVVALGDTQNIQVSLGLAREASAVDVQRFIDAQRIEEAARAGLPNPVGVYVEPRCDFRADFRATYGSICLDGTEHAAWFAMRMLARWNLCRGILLTSALVCSAGSLVIVLAVGRQRVLNEAVVLRRTIARLTNAATLGGSASAGGSALQQTPSLTLSGGGGGDSDSATFDPLTTSQRSMVGAQVAALRSRLAHLPLIDIRLVGTNLGTMIFTVWSAIACALILVMFFMLEPYPDVIEFQKSHGALRMRQFWKEYDANFRATIVVAVLAGGAPTVLVTLDVVVFAIGVVPYNLYRCCMRLRRRQSESDQKAPTGGDAVDTVVDTGHIGAQLERPRARFLDVEELPLRDRVDVFFTEWRLVNRLLCPPRLWRWVTGHDRPFFRLTLASCNAIREEESPVPLSYRRLAAGLAARQTPLAGDESTPQVSVGGGDLPQIVASSGQSRLPPTSVK